MGKPVCDMAQSFFNDDHILEELITTYIILILKIDNPNKVCHYRSINRYNVSHKIISKILANRRKNVIPNVISPLQGALLHSRDIHHN